MDEELRRHFEKLNDLLRDRGITSLKLTVVDPAHLKLLEKNARFMKKPVFDKLIKGIEKWGLQSLPLCWFDGSDYHVLSGNHRVMAARKAKKKAILVLYTDEDLDDGERIAIQLAHNRICGEDDQQMLNELWAGIKAIPLKELTGFDDEFFQKLKPLEMSSIKGSPLLVKKVSILFFQEDMDRIAEARELLEKEKADETWLAAMNDFNCFVEAVLSVKEAGNIVNTAMALRAMAEIVLEAIVKESENERAKAKTNGPQDHPGKPGEKASKQKRAAA